MSFCLRSNLRPQSLIVVLCFTIVTGLSDGVRASSDDDSAREIHVAVFNDVGTGRSMTDLMRALRTRDNTYIRHVTAAEIRDGVLSQFDVLIHPGGSGSKQGRRLEDSGRNIVRAFVKEGGGFMGFCAGAYLASADYTWSLNLLDARVLDRRHWARGTGTVSVRLTPFGAALLDRAESEVSIYYGQGPLLAPAENSDIPDYEALGTYQTEIAKNGAPTGVMIGTTAIARGRFGHGRVFCFSPHPEKTPGLERMVHRALEFVSESKPRRNTFIQERQPEAAVSVAGLTPDISQKSLPNSNYCAPCALANILYQFAARQRLTLPEVQTNTQAVQVSARQQLAATLGNENHMNTIGKNGTDRYRLVNGADRFVRSECGRRLQFGYFGVRTYDRSYIDEATRSKLTALTGVPKLSQLQHALSDGSGVVILFGSYQPDKSRGGRMERVGGHYVAVVGYGRNVDGESDSTCIVLHDSNDSFTGRKFVHAQRVDGPTELWSDGELLARSQNLVRLKNAPIRKDGRIAFLETIFTVDVAEESSSE